MQLPSRNTNFPDQVDFSFDDSYMPGSMPGFTSFTTSPEDIVDIPGGGFDPNRISFSYKGAVPDPYEDKLFREFFLGDISSFLEQLEEYLKEIREWVKEVTSSFSAPGSEGVYVPDTELPTSSYGVKNHAEIPGSSAPESSVPASSAPESSAPESSVPASSAPESSAPNENSGSRKGPANGKYDAWIEKYSAKYGVDPDVIKCIMAKESQGNPSEVSYAGAVGLMQVKPETASELLGRKVTAEELINNPELNIEVGVMYYAKMKEAKGSLEDALGAYNQGPNANWRTIPESVDYVNVITTALGNGTLPSWG